MFWERKSNMLCQFLMFLYVLFYFCFLCIISLLFTSYWYHSIWEIFFSHCDLTPSPIAMSSLFERWIARLGEQQRQTTAAMEPTMEERVNLYAKWVDILLQEMNHKALIQRLSTNKLVSLLLCLQVCHRSHHHLSPSFFPTQPSFPLTPHQTTTTTITHTTNLPIHFGFTHCLVLWSIRYTEKAFMYRTCIAGMRQDSVTLQKLLHSWSLSIVV